MEIKHPTVRPGTPEGTPLPPGSRIGRYEVLSLLGGGGMGVVYRANDTRLQREVAIKVLHEKESVPGMRERLLREARAVSAINHPSICTLFDIGEQDGDPYLVMELLQGETLRDRIRKKPLTPSEVVEYSLQIADALAEAHGNSIIHRDIKPANIFLCNKASGAIQVKVLDFGLAKRRTDIEHDSMNLTEPGTTIGTIAYMSPEQARGEPLDARTDIFSFGAVMYEMATGKVPFTGQTSAMVFVELLERNPKPVRELNRQIPVRLAAIINKALSKEFSSRYQTAVEVHTDLEAVWGEVVSASHQAPVAAEPKAPAAVIPKEVAPVMPPPIVAAPVVAAVPITSAPVEDGLPPGAIPVVPANASRETAPVMPAGSAPSVVRAVQATSTPSTSGNYRLLESHRSGQTTDGQGNALPPNASVGDPYTGPGRQRPADKSERGRAQAAEKAKAAAEEKRKNRAKLRLLYFAMVLIVATIAAGIYIQFGRATGEVGLHQSDTILIGRIDNKTESTKLDHAFRIGLAVDLMQSPYVNAVLGADGQTSLQGSKGTLVGSISGDDPYVIDVRLLAPNGGKLIAETQDTAQDLEDVLETIDRVSLDLRRQMGESIPSRDAYFRPLHQEATSSLDAMEDFSIGETTMASHHDPKVAEAAYLKALDEDKYFTLSSERLAVLYASGNNAQAAAQYAENAYTGRQTMSERSKIEIEVVHAALVDKDPNETQKWLKELHATYPQDNALNDLLKK